MSENDKKNQIFIGARPLNEQINFTLPTYDLLLKEIERIREDAKNKSSNSNIQNNNTIGIFGARGTGKTSVLYTIIEKLKEEEDFNIILPVIEPDNFGQNTKIIGSIIGSLSDIIDNELEQIKNSSDKRYKETLPEYFNNCIYKDNNPLKTKRNQLLEYHLYTENEYRKLLTHNFFDTATHIKKSSYLLTPDIKFKEKLINLVDALIDERKKINLKKYQNESFSEKTPLIFIFIDDIDLKTSKCKELIDAILQYANHPNIVTILSGDYEILKESITLSLISDENLMENNLDPHFKINEQDTIFDRKVYLTNEYLKKIIPPARRHNVLNWNTETIPYYTLGDKTLNFQLNELLGDNNFFGYEYESNNGDKKIMPIKDPYIIFDKTPRGITNVYYHIYQILRDNKEKNKDVKYDFKNIKSLIDTIITSSKDLINIQKTFLEKYLLWGNNAESTYINYEKINEKINEKDFKELLKIFFICEILKEITKNINYNEDEYNKVKKFILEQSYKNIDYYKGTIDNFIIPIALNTNLKSALLLLEYLKEEKRRVSHNIKNDYNCSEKFAFIAIYKLIKSNTDKNILQNMFLDSKYNDDAEKAKDLKESLDFLNLMCIESSSYELNKKIFNSIIQNIFKDLGDYKKDIKVMLTINTFSTITEKSFNYSNENNQDEKQKFNSKLNYIKKINSMEDVSKITKAQKRQINDIINSVSKDIRDFVLSDDNLPLIVKNPSDFKKSIETFRNGRNGLSSTIYSTVIQKTYFLCLDDVYEFSKYKECLELVEGLATNTRVWYGRYEALDFLSVLKEGFYFNIYDTEIYHLIPIIIELGEYFKKINPSIKEDIELENCKKEMKKYLTATFKEVRDEVAGDLKEIGSTLEDDEKEKEIKK